MKKALIVSLAWLATSGLATTAEKTESITLEGAVAAGTGCPAGSVEAHLSDDKKTVTLDFSRFAAEAGPGVSLAESRKNCQVLVDIRYPSGLSYAVRGLKVRGVAKLDEGVKAVVAQKYYFQGGAATATVSKELEGAYSGSYSLVESLDDDELVFSPCEAQRALSLNVTAKVESGNGRGVVAVTKLGNGNSAQLKLEWKECPAVEPAPEPIVIEPGA